MAASQHQLAINSLERALALEDAYMLTASQRAVYEAEYEAEIAEHPRALEPTPLNPMSKLPYRTPRA